MDRSDPQWAVYAEGVRLIAARALGDVTLADDIAQEAITRALATIEEGPEKPIADLGAFIHGIARHLIADVHRTRGRTIPLTTITEPEEPRRDALAAAVASEERERLNVAMRKLSESDRRILYLSYFEGLSPEEIAQRLSEGAVRIRKRKSRALQRLREAYFGKGERSREPR